MDVQGLQKIHSPLANNGSLVMGDDGSEYDAKLARVTVETNTDKYYYLQLIQDGDNYHTFSHWGRTGSEGQCLVKGPSSFDEALKEFEKLYRDKTGNSWADRNVGGEAAPLKYRHLSTLTRNAGRAQNGKWEYYLKDDHPANGGKPDGWYPYDDKAGNEVEQLYLDRADNASLVTRFVHSDTSGYTYKVDLASLSQTNTTSNKRRPIRRIGGPTVNVPLPNKKKTSERAPERTSSKKSSSSSSSSSSSKNSGAAPKKKKSVKGKKPTAELVVTPPPPVITTLNLRQQYCKGLLSDRSARKYLRSIGEQTIE